MHLTALVESTEHVCCRYRIAAFRPFLEAAGHTLEIRPLPRNWWARLRLFSSMGGANVILQRKLLPGWQLSLLRSRVARLVFDFDDAVYLRDSYSSRGLRHAGRLRRFAGTVRASDAVVAGNDFLRVHAMFRSEKVRVHVIPTCVEPDRYPPRRVLLKRRPVTLVWVGSSSTLQGLERCSSLLNELGARIPGLRLKLICDKGLSLRDLPVDLCPWDEASEADAIAAGDVGFSWIPDDDWSRGKCGLKVLQYMAAGLPVVANPVGVHVEMVHHEETGFLAESADDWAAAIGRLAADPELRERMGRAGRRVIEERYSVAVGARSWLTVLDGLLQRTARTA